MFLVCFYILNARYGFSHIMSIIETYHFLLEHLLWSFAELNIYFWHFVLFWKINSSWTYRSSLNLIATLCHNTSHVIHCYKRVAFQLILFFITWTLLFLANHFNCVFLVYTRSSPLFKQWFQFMHWVVTLSKISHCKTTPSANILQWRDRGRKVYWCFLFIFKKTLLTKH